jgi:hypothetical protein
VFQKFQGHTNSPNDMTVTTVLETFQPSAESRPCKQVESSPRFIKHSVMNVCVCVGGGGGRFAHPHILKLGKWRRSGHQFPVNSASHELCPVPTTQKAGWTVGLVWALWCTDKSLPCRESNPRLLGRPPCSPVTVVTELCRLHFI